jgi:hypothetical protein
MLLKCLIALSLALSWGLQTTKATATHPDNIAHRPANEARFVAFRKTFVITALYDNVPFRVVSLVVDSEGLAYSTSSQPFAASDDELRVHIRKYNPVIADVWASKGHRGDRAVREMIAFSDIPEGGSALALSDNRLTVLVKRLPDEVDLRSHSILPDS